MAGTAETEEWSCCCRADEVIDSSSEDVADRVEEITHGEGAYAGLDPVAKESTGMVSNYYFLTGSSFNLKRHMSRALCRHRPCGKGVHWHGE